VALDLPAGDNISELTDWVELRVAVDGAQLPLSRLNRLLRADPTELADEELATDDGVSDWETNDQDTLEVHMRPETAAAAEVDVRVERVRQEISEREEVGSNIYPFTVDDDRVKARTVCGGDVYLLLLVLGNGELPFRAERRAHEVEEAYDLVALAALRRFLGRNAEGVRFARTATADVSEDENHDQRRRPTRFEDAIVWLRGLLDLGPGVRSAADEPDTEPHWEVSDEDDPEDLGRRPLASYNDAGVDVVAWWRFADGRAGFPVLLAQCTVQITWARKLEDIKLTLWEKWIDFDTVPPQTALVIPFADRRDHPNWQDRTALAGVILDRVRLVELLDELACDELEALVDDDVRSWTRSQLRAA
jgi:hypothetical protein